MTNDVSIGPAEQPGKAPTGEVDAQQANELDMQRGLAGAEAKPDPRRSKGAGSPRNKAE
jgi:hypothetical protein